jgi:hypothetical protein
MIGEFEEGREEASQPHDSRGEENDASWMIFFSENNDADGCLVAGVLD